MKRPGSDPAVLARLHARCAVATYAHECLNGAPAVPVRDAQRVGELGFDSLSLAETVVEISKAAAIPRERVVQFFAISLEGSADRFPALLERVFVLSDSFDEAERAALLLTGVVGSVDEITPLRAPLETIGGVVKMCRAVASLADQRGHDAIDLEVDHVKPDPGWD